MAEDQDTVLGSAAVRVGEAGAEVVSVWASSAVRGTGISDLLLSAAFDWARADGHRTLRLSVLDDNGPARTLYLRNQFTETGQQSVDPACGKVEVEMVTPLQSVPDRRPVVRMRPLHREDEHAFRALRRAFHRTGFTFAKDYQEDMPWQDYLDWLEAARTAGTGDGRVPFSFFIAEDAAGALIGSSDIRHVLTEELTGWGGHIGYAVAPGFRRRGYATEILRQTLPLAADLGIFDARITCTVDNVGSRRVATGLGGRLDIISDNICRYWIDTTSTEPRRVGATSRSSTAVETVRLRPLQETDENVVRAAHSDLARGDSFPFALGLEPEMSWADYLRAREDQRQGVNLPDGIVASTFLLATVDGQVVGRTSIRHTLNDGLRRRGGHIGYAVLPQYRQRGYGTAILRRSIVVARSTGIDRILLTCDDSNLGSRRIIEACGGVLESTEPWTNGTLMCRYWIE
ncbi:GNAT family N-acetyltransferase [Nocardia puris]|uniref:GNAT family N-acetyltransferase n=1 Tax=Nocardia puris TaxID=208602 RepID=UPI001895C213|nr:GNAT family N-acetyltransferase [Nocardia puris]MBF6216298.1 GNAT family N-acetyltransferase [Nocardia puris]